MKTSKKIISIVLALVLLTSMVTSAFYASACSSNNHDPYKEASTVLDLLDNKLDAYDVDITAMLDGLVDSKQLIETANGYISEEALNGYISEFAGKYLESGQWLIDLGNEKVAELLNQYLKTGVTDELLKKLFVELFAKLNDLPEIFELDAYFPTIGELDALLEKAIGDYLDGEKLVELLDKVVADAIDGKLIYETNGRKILKAIDPELAAKLDALLEGVVAKYVNDGAGLIDMGDKALMDLLNDTEVQGVPIMQLRYLPTVDELVKNLVLADNSSIMQTAANALKDIFPNVQPTYDSLISCLIPLLSAFDLGGLMSGDIASALSLASPSAFAYLAGLHSPDLEEGYLDRVNSSLRANGYTGSDVVPIITLSDAQKQQLLDYVAMEKDPSKTLADVAQAGFDWHDFAGGANNLDIANAFVKIALGDKDKLGEVAEAPGVGKALVDILCDLLNDLKEAPVTTILKKISNAEDLTALVTLVTSLGLIGGDDDSFKSYDLYSEGIRYDRDGNTTFYDDYIDGKLTYTGPKYMQEYLPVINAAIDLLSNLYDKTQDNGGDLLKTLLKDKLPQLGNVLRSLISYTDEEGNPQFGAVAYLLDDYKEYLQAGNAVLCYELLKGFSTKRIEEAQNKINEKNVEIGKWQSYLDLIKPLSDAAKLQKAKDLGYLPESATVYDEDAVLSAMEAKAQTLAAEIAELEPQVTAAQSAVDELGPQIDDAKDRQSALNAWLDVFWEDDVYGVLDEIFSNQDATLIEQLRNLLEDDFNNLCGEGSFDDFAADIVDNLSAYGYEDGAADFIDDFVTYGGVPYNALQAVGEEITTLQAQLDSAQATLDALKGPYEAKIQELADIDSGAEMAKITAAGDSEKIYISDPSINAEGNYTASQIEETIATIQNEEIKQYEMTIAEEEANLTTYNIEQAAAQATCDNYDLEGLKFENDAFNDLVDSLMVFLGGNESTKSLYDYFDEGKPIEMLLAPDRIQALKGIVDNLISLFGDKIGTEGSDYTTQLWEIEEILFGDKGILSTLYTDFVNDPVLSVATRLAPLGDIVDIVYDMGFFRDLIDQYRGLIDAITNLFGDDTDGFISLWKQAYDDGSATHHYVNAILSILPKLINIFDELKDIEAISKAIAPYSDAIDYVLNLLSKDFYDDVMTDGIVETLLEEENLEKLQTIIDNIVINFENGEKIKAIVDEVFDKVLDGLYQDILVDPVLAITGRLNRIADLVETITSEFGIDISDYKFIIDDIKNIFDDGFTKQWKQSKVTALVNRMEPISKLLNDVVTNENILKLIKDNIPEDYKDIVDAAIPAVQKLTSYLNDISKGLVKDYQKSPIKAIAKRVPTIVDMISTLSENDKLIDAVLGLDAVKNLEVGGIKIGDIEDLIRRVLADFNSIIAPALKDTLNTDVVNTYEKNKTKGLVKVVNGLADMISGLASDTELINGILDLDPVKNIAITDDIKVGDIAGLIKTVAAMLPQIIKAIDIEDLINNLQTKPTKTIFELKDVISDAIDQIMSSKDPFTQKYVKQFKNTLNLVKDILDGLKIKGDKIVITLIDTKKPIDSLLSDANIKKIKAAAKEITSFIGDKDITAFVNSIIDLLDGLVDDIKTQPLLTTVEQLGDKLSKIIANARNIESLAKLLAPYDAAIDAALAILEDIGKDAQKSLVGAVLTRADKIKALVDALFDIEAFANIEVFGFKLSDFRSAIDLLFEFLGGDFYKDFQANPLKAIMTRIETIKAIYEYLRDSGIIDAILKELGINPVILGYNILTAVDYILPILDNQLYDDFEQSIFLAITSRYRAGRIEEALKNIIWFADIFAYSVNDALCSAISGIFGLLNGLYEDLVLPTTPANGGNQLHSTSRVLVSKFPKIQQLLKAIGPLFGTDRKLFNLTDVVSDTVKMEKDDILKLIAGVDLVKPYYYGISDVLDVVGENAAKYNWNNAKGIVDALNGVGKALVPALEKALSVSDVKWNDLKQLKCEYDPNGTPESYLVEFSGELGEGVLTSLVGTLLKAALTIPAIKDMVGEVAPEEIASLLNDLLEFDFKDNKVEFDAFNTEHLIYTAINLVLPKTASAASPATADEIVMISVAIITAGAATAAVIVTLKKRRRELVDIEG